MFPFYFYITVAEFILALRLFELILLLAKYRASFIAAIGFENVCIVHCRRSILGYWH